MQRLYSARNLTPNPSPYQGYGVHTSRITPLNPPDGLGGKRNLSSSLPFTRGGLGWGNSRTGSDSITCVYTIALPRRGEIKHSFIGVRLNCTLIWKRYMLKAREIIS
jgi:hypothetical protein